MPTMQSYEPIQVLDYDARWPAMFNALATRVRDCVGAIVSRIEHIGSTAVPGLAAKPIIDLDVVVASAVEIPLAVDRLATIGYLHEGNLGLEGREAFRWPAGECRHHLYLLVEGASELRRHLAFRDALRADPNLCIEYATLKRSLADRHHDDIDAYTFGKNKFVESVLNRW